MESEEDGSELAAERKTPETILIECSNRQLVQRAIEELPAHFREVLLLCEVEEMSYQQIAEILSIPIGTVMSRLARARRAIRESFKMDPRGAQRIERLASSPNRTRGMALCVDEGVN
jgi:RNA polymerase sigma-70 factor (ECF subfamily)